MYAAAGGASIASRRKQKRLLLNKRNEGALPTAVTRIKSVSTSNSSKFTRPHIVPPPTLPPPPAPPPLTSLNRRRNERNHHHQHLPVSPLPAFPISPPPLSLESSNSITIAKPNSFPFPPPSILDLRVSPSASELQCGSQGPGKAAWQGCNRPSPLSLSPTSPHGSRCEGQNYKTKQCEAHRRWMKRNRIRDASYCYGSSGEEEENDGSSTADRRRVEVNAAVNTVLYAGLGTTALGLVISFVGTGEKGFQSPELRLVGPSLLCAGLLCCLLRVLLCLCLCHCGECHWRPCVVSVKKEKKRNGETSLPGPLPTASLLPPLQQSPMPLTCHVPATSKGHELLLSPAQLPE